MNSKRQAPAVVQRISPRQGEGHAVDISIIATDAHGITSSLDLTQVPVPDRRFSADAAQVKVEKSLVKLLFGQREPISGGLLALVVISMTFEAVHQFLGTIDREFEAGYRALAEKIPTEGLSEFSTRAEQTVVLNSSIVLVGYNGTIGCIDFYFASPFAIRQLAILRKLSLEPVVRVNLPAGVLFAILDALREQANSLPSLVSKES